MKRFEKAILRTSAFPFDFIQKLHTLQLDEAIELLLADAFFVSALKLASPELLREGKRLAEIDDIDKERRIKYSLLKYAARISSRATPFGMFSGLTTIPIANSDNKNNNQIQIGSQKKFKRHFRLDMNFSNLYISVIIQHPILQKHTKFFPNTTLYSQGNYYRLIAYKVDEKKREYDLISIEKNEYLTQIIEHAKNGIYLKDLITMFTQQGIALEEVTAYINDLIHSQLIISELEPSTIGPEIEIQLLNKLERLRSHVNDEEEKRHFHTIIHFLKALIQQLDALNQPESTALDYENVIQFIKANLPKEINADELEEKYMIQCNTEIVLDEMSCVSEGQLKLVEKAIKIANHFNANETLPQPERLKQFQKSFSERYDSKFVPLVEALDVESGIGYGLKSESSSVDISPIIQGIEVGYQAPSEEKMTWHKKITSFWIEKIKQTLLNNLTTIELTAADLSPFKEKTISHSTTYVAKVGLFKKNKEDAILFDFYSGGTATSWFGRFCNGNPKINDLTHEISEYEHVQQDHVLVAEINHLPESRLGNVIQRPQYRNYQINYLAGHNNINNEQDISIEDLMIGIEQGKLVLISKKHQKQVFTYHSNAFNISYPTNLPLFQFLADLSETNNQNGFGLDLSSFHRFFNFIPRISYENIVLCRASWQFKKADFDAFKNVKDDALSKAIKQFVKKYKLPHYVVLKQGDNELLINVKNEDSFKILLQEAKSTNTIQLVEFMLNEFEAAIQNKNGEQFNNELLLAYGMPLENKRQKNYNKELSYTIQDRFSPGSEWLYYKVYLGIKNADKLLMELTELTHQLIKDQKIDQWFFIRYYDTKEHLRIRFHLNDLSHIGMVIQKVHNFFSSFEARHGMDNFVMDSYQRELSRYGYDHITSFEKIFYFDSQMCIQLIQFFDAHEKSDLLWLAAMYSADAYCELFELTLDNKITFLEAVEKAFRQEFGAISATTKSINSKYNKHKELINSLFLAQETSSFNEFKAIIDERNALCKPIVDKIKLNYPNAASQFLDSLIHMSINRLFRSNQRLHEFVVYAFLKKIMTTKKYVKKPVVA